MHAFVVEGGSQCQPTFGYEYAPTHILASDVDRALLAGPAEQTKHFV
jgi:hypothetical protein